MLDTAKIALKVAETAPRALTAEELEILKTNIFRLGLELNSKDKEVEDNKE